MARRQVADVPLRAHLSHRVLGLRHRLPAGRRYRVRALVTHVLSLLPGIFGGSLNTVLSFAFRSRGVLICREVGATALLVFLLLLLAQWFVPWFRYVRCTAIRAMNIPINRVYRWLIGM
jgi:hypothetical protein